ncbi:MAG: 30S ribosomal protein S17, partial [Candidatus Berkelbacteria bacterium]|nr:30S ribosomal protein S17 [Candidatus Berkelbacteria bacterium]
MLSKKTGVVISDKMDKTVVVLVESIRKHPIYKKQFTISKKYKVEDADN